MTPSTASRNHFFLTLQSITTTRYYSPLERPFLPLGRDAEGRTVKHNSGMRSRSCQGHQQTQKKQETTPHHHREDTKGRRRAAFAATQTQGGRGSGPGRGWRRMAKAQSCRRGLRRRAVGEEEAGKALSHPRGGDAGGVPDGVPQGETREQELGLREG